VNAAAWVLLALAGAAAVADWVAVVRRPEGRALEYVAKPLTLIVLIGVAVALDPENGAQRGWFVAALVLCLAGDVFLMLPRERFVAGLASFLSGHLAYVVGFTVEDGFTAGRLAVGAAAVAAAAAVAGRRVLVAVRRGSEAALIGPVIAYMAVISAMVACAVGTGDVVAAAGAALFYGSDLTIALTRFERPRPWGPLTIMLTYHLAQALLVLSLVR
jgi:uncharacterized membrane protein YhhN